MRTSMTEDEYSGPWSNEDRKEAQSEGWDVVKDSIVDCHPDHLKRGAFADAEGARAFVQFRAVKGSLLHLKAHRIHRDNETTQRTAAARTMPPPWSEADIAAAVTEGWELYILDRSRIGGRNQWRVRGIDGHPWRNADEPLAHVMRKRDEDSDLHRRAWKLHGTEP
jgi:hypothetical protein